MTFYQELQLGAADFKRLIAGLQTSKEKFVHSLIFVFKVLLNLGFSISVVMLMGLIFGNENLITGLVVLFGISTFRFTDLDIRATHSVPAVFMIFAILAFGPKAANLVPVGCDLCVNFVCIFFIVLLGCHNTRWYNHAVLVLAYLLLHSYDLSGFLYVKRLLCLLFAATVTSLVLYRNRRKTKSPNTFRNLFTDFSFFDERGRWQFKIAFCVAGALFLATMLSLPKPLWSGIAAMSVTIPKGELQPRAVSRIRANVYADVIFLVSSLVVPIEGMTYLSMVGGASAGLCGKYEGQTTWNAFSALTVAVSTYGVYTAFVYRIINNFLGAAFALLFGVLIETALLAITRRIGNGGRRKGKRVVNA